MAEEQDDKQPTIAELHKLFHEGKYRDFKDAASVFLSKKPVPVDHIISIFILGATIADPQNAAKTVVYAQGMCRRARASSPSPAQARVLEEQAMTLEKLEEAIQNQQREWSQEKDGKGQEEPESDGEEADGEDGKESSLDRTADQEASNVQDEEKQEGREDQQQQHDAVPPIRGRVHDKSTEAEAPWTDHILRQGQDKLICDKCQAPFQEKEALAAHHAQCKLPDTDTETERLEREIENLQKKLAEHKEKRRTALQAEREIYVTKIRKLQSLVEMVAHELTKL